jgi:hypothetical protein
MVAAPLLGMVLLIGLLAKSGSFLKIDDPAASDVIVVLAGEADKRAERGLALLRKGYAPRLVLDVPADTKIYNLNQLELAQKYVQQLPDRERISICPIHGTSTTAEVKELPPCLTAIPAKRVLVVTSDYHTRRALSICRKLLPQHEFQIAAAEDAREFGVNWWQQREWAKTSLEEWSKLIWWGAVDQWQ